MGNLDRLDFDISGDAFPQEKNVKIIDIYSTSSEKSKEENAIDKYVVFSSNLIKCFKSKLKDSSARLRVESLIKAYKAAADTYNKDDKHSLSLWCMANVNCFLDITEGKNFNIEPSESQLSRASEDLEKFNLIDNFDSIEQLYIETRQEAIKNAIASHWMEI